jgi:hypothetical protein
VNPTLGQAAFIPEVQFVLENLWVQRVRARLQLVLRIGSAYEIRLTMYTWGYQ